MAKVTAPWCIQAKKEGKKITMLTAYDALLAKMLDNAEIDFVDLISAIDNDRNPLKNTHNIFQRNCHSIISSPIRFLSFKDQKETRKKLQCSQYLSTDQYSRYVLNYNHRFGRFHNKKIFPILINNAKGCVNGINHCLYCSIYDLKVQFGDTEFFWQTIKKYYFNHGINFFFEV